MLPRRQSPLILGEPTLSWRQIANSPAAVLVIATLTALWLIATVGRIFWNGYVYEFAYPLWYPDGVNYSYRAFVAAGVEPLTATQWLNEMYSDREVPIPPGTPLSEATVNSRVMFVILGTPFVRAFGTYGLLVAPSLGLLAAALIPAVMLIRRGALLAALLGSGLLLASTSMLRWSVANLTEGILIGLFAAMLPLLPWDGRNMTKVNLLVLALLSIGVSLTRQTLPVLIAVTLMPALLLWLRHRIAPWPWLQSLVAVGVPASIVFVVTFPRDSFFLLPYAYDAGGKDGLGAAGRIVNLFVDLFRLSAIELGQLGVLDRSLLLLIGLATFVVIVRRLDAVAAAWIGVALAGAFLTAWVGAGGVNFRYSMPLASISVLMLAGLTEQKRTD